mmetsp:Transcript_80670/g.233284  ORF Transcript_80670/g.233284 Transcript_80670/m.233284 type:complete len:232 (-) Transcript_80670:149-844(-)
MHEANVVVLMQAVRHQLLRVRDLVALQTQPQGQARAQPGVVPALRGRPDQAEGPLIRDAIVRDVNAVHREGLGLRVQVLDQGVHDGVVEDIPVGLEDDARHPVIPENREQLVQAVRSDHIIGQVHVGSAFPHIWEIGHHQRHLLIKPIAEAQERGVDHRRVAVLQLNLDLTLPHDDHALVPRHLAVGYLGVRRRVGAILDIRHGQAEVVGRPQRRRRLPLRGFGRQRYRLR